MVKLKQQSLRTQIIRLILVTVVLVTFVILTVVWVATLNTAQNDIEKNISLATNVLERTINNANVQLYKSALVLTSDFGFKQAVASRDAKTIQSVLVNHTKRIDADLMAILDMNGNITASSNQLLTVGDQFFNPTSTIEALNDNGGLAFYQIENKLISVVVSTVRAPTPIAIALVGFEINSQFINELSEMIGQDLQLSTNFSSTPTLWPRQSAATNLTLSTLTSEQLSKASLIKPDQITLDKVFFNNQHDFISNTKKVYSELSFDVLLTVLQPLETVFKQSINLLLTIVVLAFFICVIAIISSIIFSKQIIKPLMNLANFADAIAQGRYETLPIEKKTTSEIQLLTHTFMAMQKQIKEREDHIAFQANHDALTQLINQKKLIEVLDDLYIKQECALLVYLKVADLRNIFDTFGYESGEFLLKQVAQNLTQLGGPIARTSGGNFIWVSTKNIFEDSMKDDQRIAKIKTITTTTYSVDNQVIRPHFDIGILQIPADASTAISALMRLNITIDAAKNNAQSLACYSLDLEREYTRRLDILNELKNELALPVPIFTLNFQPKFRLSTMMPERAEALIRWTSPQLGFISPDIFIALAEQAGLISQITYWVIAKVIRQQYVWRQNDIFIQVAINLSVYDIENQQLLDFISSELAKYDLPVRALSFEVTESGLMNDPENTINLLRKFREYGFSLSIDDFGTGYSSLAYLKSMPIDELKIDKAFVLKLNEDGQDQSIVETVLSLSSRFKLEAVAEGIENLASLKILKQLNCDWAQGFYLSRPIKQEDFLKWYKEYNREVFLTQLREAG